jgi:nitroreductase
MTAILKTTRRLPSTPMDVREALYTTRAMRRVKADPIPIDVQARILDTAIRAPSGGNSQNWRFMLVDDQAVKDQLGPLYRQCIEVLHGTLYVDQITRANNFPESEESQAFFRMQASAVHLSERFESYPLMLFAFNKMDPSGGSIFPAIWNAMLAARAENVGASLTSVLRMRKDEVFKILGVPTDEGWANAGCVCFGYPTGRWGVAPRRPAHEVSCRNHWNTPVGIEIPQPLWPERLSGSSGRH